MGRTHAVSGLVAVAAGAALDIELHRHLLPWLPVPSPATAVVSAVVVAGAALLPDIDMEPATASKTLGPVTQWLSRGITRACVLGYYASRRTEYDRRDCDGHRTWTHTLLFVLAAGIAVAMAGAVGGNMAGASVIYLCAAGAIRALVPRTDLARAAGVRRRHGAWIRAAGVHLAVHLGALAVTLALLLMSPRATGWAWLGVPVAAGVLVHCLGDAATIEGCPLWAPWRAVRGRTWYGVGSSKGPRIRCGTDRPKKTVPAGAVRPEVRSADAARPAGRVTERHVLIGLVVTGCAALLAPLLV